ncbi:MAG: dihydroneopterin aldolase [Bacteroidetes bacterium]|jgi:dihydroneopterin aldolase|nr:dihydroneopterin aldolase [Bacteroidota bacterium]
MLDRITIKSLKFHAKHGHNEQERIDGNTFEVDVVAYGAFREAAAKDNNLQETFNYQKAEEASSRVMFGPSRKLIETLCSEIGDQIFADYPIVQQLSVSVRKLSPPIETEAAYAEITMQWNR